ncbi:MAG: hypothetical protein GC168_15380 [Candidatus Hydrogenedens sp.]|nr:hypothetical protein [Candidatus Hydrogenedens sp.]
MSMNPGGGAVRELTADTAGRFALFQETQTFGAWVYALVLASFLFSIMAAFHAMTTSVDADTPAKAAVAFTAAVGMAVTSLLLLRTRVDGVEISVSLGVLPLLRMHLRLSDITEARVVEYRPLRDAGGWGMRFGRFEGERCRYWNARGNQGVLLVTPRGRYIIGSQQPEDLLAAVLQGRPRKRTNGI